MDTIISTPFVQDHFHEGLIEILGKQDAGEFIASKQAYLADAQTRGILIKAGRAGFYYWLRQNHDSIGWNDPAFRLHPVKGKITNGLQSLCQHLEREANLEFIFHNETTEWKVAIQGVSEVIPCGYIWGFVQEFARWAGSGRFYEVRETSCRMDRQPQCELVIKKIPQD
jgi:hypothetical protein